MFEKCRDGHKLSLFMWWLTFLPFILPFWRIFARLPVWSIHHRSWKETVNIASSDSRPPFVALRISSDIWSGFGHANFSGMNPQTHLFRCSYLMKKIHNKSPERRLGWTTQYQYPTFIKVYQILKLHFGLLPGRRITSHQKPRTGVA